MIKQYFANTYIFSKSTIAMKLEWVNDFINKCVNNIYSLKDVINSTDKFKYTKNNKTSKSSINNIDITKSFKNDNTDNNNFIKELNDDDLK